MPAAELKAFARSVRNSDRWAVYDRVPVYEEKLWKAMLDLIYAGHADQAKRFFDKAWPGKMLGKNAFYREFIFC